MRVNKVDLANGENLIDLTSDTVTPQTLAKGVTAHNSKGEQIIGNLNPEGGGTGSGIIDVTELPTENIDENAVYRVTENIQTSATNCYIIENGSVYSMTEFLESMGVPTVPNFYEVDELSADIKGSDIATFSELNFYVLRTDGNCYIYIPEYGMTTTVGSMFFQDPAYDKGSTENVYAETDEGIYTTLEAFKDVVRYFIRENGEWEEVTAYYKSLNSYGFVDTNMLSGDITDKIFSVADIMSRDCIKFDENWFVKRDGSCVEEIPVNFFLNCKFTNVVIPKGVSLVGSEAFGNCYSLTEVTFKGTPATVTFNSFSGCESLTTINVPWAEGGVASAPWGAKNATINYNYTEG